MWLPECAADNESLAALARAGIKFTILAPGQGRFISEELPAARSARSNGGRATLSLAIFRFERELSGQIAFSDLLTDGGRLANWLADVALRSPRARP
jgi:hypothetical protein